MQYLERFRQQANTINLPVIDELTSLSKMSDKLSICHLEITTSKRRENKTAVYGFHIHERRNPTKEVILSRHASIQKTSYNVPHTNNVLLKMRKILESSRPLFCNVFLRFWRNFIEWNQSTDPGIPQQVF